VSADGALEVTSIVVQVRINVGRFGACLERMAAAVHHLVLHEQSRSWKLSSAGGSNGQISYRGRQKGFEEDGKAQDIVSPGSLQEVHGGCKLEEVLYYMCAYASWSPSHAVAQFRYLCTLHV
jgi:hypothetical protein